VRWVERQLSTKKYEQAKVEYELEKQRYKSGGAVNDEISTETPGKPWDAQKVDEKSFSKEGITCAVGYVDW